MKVFDLAQGINMLTRQPAELYSLKDRGLLAMRSESGISDASIFDRVTAVNLAYRDVTLEMAITPAQ